MGGGKEIQARQSNASSDYERENPSYISTEHLLMLLLSGLECLLDASLGRKRNTVDCLSVIK